MSAVLGAIHARSIDLAGQTFGHWTVIEPINGGAWKVQCVCGRVKGIRTDVLTRGRSRSCGCRGRLRAPAPRQPRPARPAPARKSRATKPQPRMLRVGRFQQALEDSYRPIAIIAEEMGYLSVRTRGGPREGDVSRLRRKLGLEAYTAYNGVKTFHTHIDFETAVLFLRAADFDPVDFGL